MAPETWLFRASGVSGRSMPGVFKTGRGGLRKVSFVPERSGDESWNGQAKALLRLA